MGIFSDAQGQLTLLSGSGRIRPNFELMQALMYVIVTCKYKKDPIKKQSRKRDDALFPIITLWELSVAMETRVLI